MFRLFIVAAVFFSLTLFGAVVPSAALGSARVPQVDAAAFESSAAWKKIDLRFREAWRTETQAGRMNTPLECIVKTTRPVSSEMKALFASAGFTPRTTIGSIVTGVVVVGKLPQVAGLDFVQAMELATPLSKK